MEKYLDASVAATDVCIDYIGSADVDANNFPPDGIERRLLAFRTEIDNEPQPLMKDVLVLLQIGKIDGKS